jgi:hypothetical protein
VQVAAVGRPHDIEAGRELIAARRSLTADQTEKIADTSLDVATLL